MSSVFEEPEGGRMFTQSKGNPNADNSVLDVDDTTCTTATNQLYQTDDDRQSFLHAQQQITQELAYLRNQNIILNMQLQQHGNYSQSQHQYLPSQSSFLFQQHQQQQYEQDYFQLQFQSQLPLSQNFHQPHLNGEAAAVTSAVEGGQQQQQPLSRLRKRKASPESKEASVPSKRSTLDNLAAAALIAVRSSAPRSSSRTTSSSPKSSSPKSIPPPIQKRVRWTPEEDASLSALLTQHGGSWTLVASKIVMGRRFNKQCHDRWQTIDPKYERGEWSEVEKTSLVELAEKYGIGKWHIICEELEVPSPEAGGSGKPRNAKQCRMQWFNHQEGRNNKRDRKGGEKADKKRLEEEEDSEEEW
jgi:hypothetical protein